MAQKDLHSNISVLQSLAPQSVTGATNGSGVDLAGYESAEVAISLGAFAGTTPTVTVKIQESDDNSTFSDVAATDLLGGALPASGVLDGATYASTVVRRGYIGSKRYIRAIVSAVGGTSTPSALMGANVIAGHYRHAPTP